MARLVHSSASGHASELLNIEQGRENGKRTYAYARAVENRVWYVACDYAPRNSDGGTQAGAAYIINPNGRLVTLSDRNQSGENMVVHTIELPALAAADSTASSTSAMISAIGR